MKTFLEYVAGDILRKYGTDLSRIAVVFPNKRASLFLNSHLAQLSGQPIWSPAYITISDLFRQHSSRTVADSIKLVCDLHQSFTSQTGMDESLDRFYGWGQLLLADFDDIDKNMADADKVFRNLRDIHELDDVSYLSEEQKEAIRRFFSNFSDEHNSLLKQRFLQLWSKIGAIYEDFNQRLAAQGLAYEGALYREVAEKPDLEFEYDTYLFIGFNLLQKVEQHLFTNLKKQGKARFYWDFDQSYMQDDGVLKNEAGHYIQQHLADFPNEFNRTDEAIYNQFAKSKRIRFISATTENAQARYVSQWLRTDNRISDGRHTAVVLCNEGLLPMVIHCLPDEVEKVNITTGYPLTQSPVASLVTMLIELRTSGYDAKRQRYRQYQLKAVMRHPYIAQLPADEAKSLVLAPIDPLFFNERLLQWLCELLQRLAREEQESPLAQESIFRCYTLLNRLLGLVVSGNLQVNSTTLQRLVSQLIQSTSVPFHGEPAEGLQVMGVLETRDLDFDHVVLLSCNEGNMPRGVNDTSFIPYSIRKAYGLTTIDHKVAIYSYYFHRLLQRASDITILYNNCTIDGQTGEMSRFMLQMMVEDTHHDIQFQTIQVPAAINRKEPPVIKLENKKPMAFLSPTAINTYLRCPLRYYYKYECDLREPDTNEDDTIDNRIFGNIFHEASQILYTRLMEKSRQILASDIEQLLKTRVDIERAVDEAFQKELPNLTVPTGIQIINREVIIHYLRQLLSIDHALAPFTVIGLECDVKGTLETPHITTTIGGRIDRLDRIVKDGKERIRVIDYKTGSKTPKPLANVEAIFQQESLQNHSDYYLQTFVYAHLVSKQHPEVPVSPALLFIQHAGTTNYDPTLCFGKQPITDIKESSASFEALLKLTVDDMFNPDIPYTATDDRNRCNTCPYKLLCGL